MGLLSIYSIGARAESRIFTTEDNFTLTEWPCIWSSEEPNLEVMKEELIESCTNAGYNECKVAVSRVIQTDGSRNLFCGISRTYNAKVSVKGER